LGNCIAGFFFLGWCCDVAVVSSVVLFYLFFLIHKNK